jgi:Alcohol dehydrogenase GroES-like domain
MRIPRTLVRVVLLSVAVCSLRAQTTNPTMKAAVLRSYGGPEAARLEEIPRPEPQDDQILIKVIAASVNPVDVAIRKGYLAEIIGNKFPLVLGMDAAGIVEKAGAKITKFKVGDPVYAFFTLTGEGGYAEYVIAKESEVGRKPKGRELRAGCGGAGGRIHGMAGPELHGQTQCRPDRAHSRRIGRSGTSRYPDCESGRRESDCDCIHCESALSQANGRGHGD